MPVANAICALFAPSPAVATVVAVEGHTPGTPFANGCAQAAAVTVEPRNGGITGNLAQTARRPSRPVVVAEKRGCTEDAGRDQCAAYAGTSDERVVALR